MSMSQPPAQSERDSVSPPRVFDTTSKLVAFVIGVLAIVAGVGAGMFNPFLSNSASSQGILIDALFSVLLGIATSIFVIVQGFLLYSIVRFSREPDDETDGMAFRGHTGLEIVWTAVPAAIVVFLAVFSYQVLAEIEQPRPDELIVEVTAQQYAWSFFYPDLDLTSTELHMPLDRQVLLRMRSKDVIHAFWVPQFRIKRDVMPDRLTEARITGTEIGTYPIVCAELCGVGHSYMRSQAVVQSAADFLSWQQGLIGAKTRGAGAKPADPMAAGRQLFTQGGCNACHALADAGAAGQLGPKLDGIGTTAATRVPGQFAEAYIRTSIVKPNDTIVPGYQPVMPQDYGQRLPPRNVDTLVQYLLGQK